MSSDSEPEDPRKIRASQGALKSLFASDRRAVENGPPSLKYDPRQANSPSQVPLPNQPSQVVATQGAVVAFRGEHPVGPCLVAVMVQTAGNSAFIVVVNREKKPQCRVRLDSSLQLLINESDPCYATLYDPAIHGHWMLQFKTPQDTLSFVVGALSVQHYILLSEGQAPTDPFVDLIAPDSSKAAVRAGPNDVCHVGYKVWLVQRVGQTPLFTAGKVVEEVPQEAPKSVTIGSNTVMQGIEEALRGVTKGTRRVVFIPPRKTKSTGLGNPEIGVSDSVVVVLTVNSVDKALTTDEFGLPQSESDDSGEENILHRKSASRRRVKPRKQDSDDDLLVGPGRAKMITGPAPAPAVASPVVSSGLDTNALLQTVLLQSLQQQKAPQADSASSVAASDINRSVERLHYQIQSLYDKIDRIDFEKYLQTNNQVIEKIVKKAVGKMPVNDVDVEDVTKDRNELLALIEQLKLKNQELTDNYHKALETLGKHKDETSGLKNDLMIEREASAQRFNELKERKRLELVDLEVKHRREIERVQSHNFEEGQKKGYAEGYNAGKIDAIEVSGSSSMSDMKQMLHKKDTEIVELGSRVAQMEGRLIQERREFKEQVDALNNLIARMEDRRSSATEEFVSDITAQTKRIRRIMNSVYASAEEQFYATECETIPVADALAMLLVSVKTETRSAVDEIKNEAAVKENSDKMNRNEVVDAYTLASEELRRGGKKRTKFEDVGDVAGLADNDDISDPPPVDIDALRRELEAFEGRVTGAPEAYEAAADLQAAEAAEQSPDFKEEGFDFSSLPMGDDAVAPVIASVEGGLPVDDADGVPEISFD